MSDSRIASAMQAILSETRPAHQHSRQADCIVVFPSVKKVAIGIGGSIGRGVMVCAQERRRTGSWGAPAMYKLDQGSIGGATVPLLPIRACQ